MHKSAILLLVFVAIAFLAALLAPLFRNHMRAPEARSPLVEIRRINPPPEAGKVIECGSAQFVDFQYEIRNHGRQPIRGVELDGSSCSCEISLAPPDEIPEGAAARVGFRLRAPPFGSMEKHLKLLDESGATIAAFSAVLRVEFRPPAFVRPLEDLHVSFVKGDLSSRELHLTTIERKGTPPWITGIVSMPDDLLQVLSVKVDQSPQPDQTLAQRLYRFKLACPSVAFGRHTGVAVVQTRSEPPETSEIVSLTVEVLDQVSVVPKQITVSTKGAIPPKSRRVVLVHRLGEGEVLPPEFDDALLSVRPVKGLQGRAVAFDVSARTENPCETRVLFPLKDGPTKELTVRIQKPASKQGGERQRTRRERPRRQKPLSEPVPLTVEMENGGSSGPGSVAGNARKS